MQLALDQTAENIPLIPTFLPCSASWKGAAWGRIPYMEGVLRAKPLSRTGSDEDSYNLTGSLMKAKRLGLHYRSLKDRSSRRGVVSAPRPVAGLWLIQTLCSQEKAWPNILCPCWGVTLCSWENLPGSSLTNCSLPFRSWRTLCSICVTPAQLSGPFLMSFPWLARPSKNMSFVTGMSWSADRACPGHVKILNVLLCPDPLLNEETDFMQRLLGSLWQECSTINTWI